MFVDGYHNELISISKIVINDIRINKFKILISSSYSHVAKKKVSKPSQNQFDCVFTGPGINSYLGPLSSIFSQL